MTFTVAFGIVAWVTLVVVVYRWTGLLGRPRR